MGSDETMDFFRLCLGDEWEEDAIPMQLSGQQVTELLWPLNEVFRTRLAEIQDLPYDPALAPAADSILDDVAATLDLDVLGQAPARVMRVLFERHKQMIVVAMANELVDNPVMMVPRGLSTDQQRIAVMLRFLHGMELPWPPGGPGSPAGH